MIINSGDVIEFEGRGGPTTALVLLASDRTLVIDLLTGDTPYVVGMAELAGLRVFDPAIELRHAA